MLQSPWRAQGLVSEVVPAKRPSPRALEIAGSIARLRLRLRNKDVLAGCRNDVGGLRIEHRLAVEASPIRLADDGGER